MYVGKLDVKTLESIRSKAKEYEPEMTAFLRAIVSNPGESCEEQEHASVIYNEMVKLGFDKVKIDPQGNVLGEMGSGKTLIAFDAHIDTVGIGNRENWRFDPYQGFETETEIGGRGTSDHRGTAAQLSRPARIFRYNRAIQEPSRASQTDGKAEPLPV